MKIFFAFCFLLVFGIFEAESSVNLNKLKLFIGSEYTLVLEGGDIVSVIPKPSLWIKIRKAYSRSVGNYQAVTLPQGWFMKRIFFVAKSAMFSF